MDTDVIAKAAGAGLATGLTTMLVATIILLPASYMMNRFIYHTPMMRAILGLIAGAGSIFTFIVLVGLRWYGWGKSAYFGLLPVLAEGSGSEPEGWTAPLFKLWNVIRHPLIMFYNEGAYEQAIEGILLPKGVPEGEGHTKRLGGAEVTVRCGAVQEEFFKAARTTAAIKDPATWDAATQALSDSGIGQLLFSDGCAA
jgi:hypothetical protein